MYIWPEQWTAAYKYHLQAPADAEIRNRILAECVSAICPNCTEIAIEFVFRIRICWPESNAENTIMAADRYTIS